MSWRSCSLEFARLTRRRFSVPRSPKLGRPPVYYLFVRGAARWMDGSAVIHRRVSGISVPVNAAIINGRERPHVFPMRVGTHSLVIDRPPPFCQNPATAATL
jgi:hypothetical protein